MPLKGLGGRSKLTKHRLGNVFQKTVKQELNEEQAQVSLKTSGDFYDCKIEDIDLEEIELLYQ